jgi:hypothetical protein
LASDFSLDLVNMLSKKILTQFHLVLS